MTKKKAVQKADIDEGKLSSILILVGDEFVRASSKNPEFNSCHEGYAVILEELDELWDQVKMKSSKRSVVNMREEAIQVAAMAIRFYHDLL